jgi:transcriptional regulator with XRE-family HTH domain
MISREQIKAARAMLDWSQRALAENCESVSEPTIKLIETGKINSTPETLGALQQTLEDAGIEFLPQHGVRFRDDLLTVIERHDENDNVYLKLLDDMFYTLKDTGGEVLFSFVDNSVTPEIAIEKQKLIRSQGVRFRFLVRNDDNYLIWPVEEYRYLPEGQFLNNPAIVYGNKFAVLVQEPGWRQPMKFILINDPSIAEIKRKEFEIIWNTSKPATKTTVEAVND